MINNHLRCRIITIIIISILFFMIPFKVLAAPNISILSFPSSIAAGQEFDVNFSVTDAIPTSEYYAKGLGGENFTEVDTKNGDSWYQQNAAWASMPIVMANSEATISGIFKVRFDSASIAASKQFKIRIRKTDNETNYDSSVVSIDVSAASTPTPTPTQSPTPSPSLTPSPSKTPTPTPVPTKTPTPKSTPTSTPEVLGEEAVNDLQVGFSTASPTPNSKDENSRDKFPTIAVIFIGAGLLLIGFSGYLAFRKTKLPTGL